MLASRDNKADSGHTNDAGDVTSACPQLLDANVPPAFVFRIVSADGGMALCVDARQLDHLDKLGGSRTLRDAIEYAVLNALPAGASVAQNPAVAAAVSDAVDLNAARFKARWRQIDPAHGVEPLPSVDGILNATLRPRIYAPPGLPAAAIQAVWARDPAGQRLRYAAVSPDVDGGVARSMGIAGQAIVLPPDLLTQWSSAFAQGRAAPDERLAVVTYNDPVAPGRTRRALLTRERAMGGDDDVGGTQERAYTSVSGAQVRLPRDAVLDEVPVQPFVGLALHSVDPALTGVAYGYAIPGTADTPATDALVPYDALWHIWEGRSDAPPTDVTLPQPLAAAAAQIDMHPDIGRIDLIAAPSVFAPVASIVVAPAAQDAADALAAYEASVLGDVTVMPTPVQKALDSMPVVADGQLIVIPPDMWAPVRVAYPVALVVRRLFGHVRRDSSDAYQVERVPVAVMHAAPYEVSMEPLDVVGAPMESYDALKSYYAAGPRGQRHLESPVGDAAEARAIEAAVRAREALDGTAGAGPSLDVLMANRQAPTSRERAHWSQFMRRVARNAGGLVPPSPVAAENQREEEEEPEGPGRLAGLHIEPLPGTAGPHRVLRYDTARDVWHDVSLTRPALPSLSDDDVEALLLAPLTMPGAARAPAAVFYLVGPAGVPVSPADLARSVTFAPEALAGAERQEGRRRVEAQRAQTEARAQARAANVRAMAEAAETTRRLSQPQMLGGSVLGRRKQPPTPSPTPPPAAMAQQPTTRTSLGAAAVALTPPQLPAGLARQAETSLAALLASGVPDTVALLMGVAPRQVRDILTGGAWAAVVGGRDADAERLASMPAEPQNLSGPSLLDVVDNSVYEFAGVGPEIVDQVVDRTARDPRWRPETDGQVTPRRVLGVIAAAFDPVVRARTADPDSNASAVILNQVYFALARQARA
ncbi:hypothetical protein pmac_cds_389 [Pandoravirus macleodensis]|uniref:Uncharacterized protein n=1 Tax=Pandoravirus macleodensis TaxID=2107707 RepID=A0A2U7UF53_9VIRU|nr:hypothetical protein pmac_cds_389 [Pandoravirus macleodensis]AVK77077.1 hypothetical protein pmac_cds_389 [Pandoravirus macleodensis]